MEIKVNMAMLDAKLDVPLTPYLKIFMCYLTPWTLIFAILCG